MNLSANKVCATLTIEVLAAEVATLRKDLSSMRGPVEPEDLATWSTARVEKH